MEPDSDIFEIQPCEFTDFVDLMGEGVPVHVQDFSGVYLASFFHKVDK